MNAPECPVESEVVAAVNSGRWPARVDEDLRAHVAGCAICQDVVAVSAAFAEELVAGPRPPLPDPSAVWLRAQLRARMEAARLVERPITFAQAGALATVVGVGGALVGASSPGLQAALQWVAGSLAYLDPRGLRVPPVLWSLVAEHVGIAVAIGLGVMLMPVAVYWVTREN
jgi:hypothetical protein